MATLLQDARYALRVLFRQPGFAAVVVLTLAVGLGANGAVFAMVDALLLRPLGAGDVEGVVQIFETNPAQRDDRDGVSVPNYLDWVERSRSFESLVATEWWDASLSEQGLDPEQTIGRRVTADFFRTLKLQPAVGRAFLPGEDTPGRDRVAVVSHRLWQRRWGGAPLVGRTILINREPHTVIGIAPAGFDYPMAVELWVPLAFDEESRTLRARRSLDVIGRLRPGVTLEQAGREMEVIAARLATEYREANGGRGASVMPLSEAMLDLGTTEILAIWQFAVLLVLLIACANVANLLLVRGMTRQRELALRLAVGASRWRVVRQLVVESLLLGVAGAALAVPVAGAAIGAIKSFMPPEIARFVMGWERMDVDGRLLAATMVAGVLTGVVFGAIPAMRASNPELTETLKEGARGSAGGRRRLLQGFVVAQVALALALLVSAGLSTRGVVRLITQYDGYEPGGIMTFGLTLPDSAYPDDESRRRFVERVLERTEALPQAEQAAFTTSIPFGGVNSRRAVEVEGRPAETSAQQPQIDFRSVTPGYFDVLRVNVIRGRAFTDADRAGAPPVALIDSRMAGQLWPGVNPIGRRFRMTVATDAPWLTVVGVVSDVKQDWFSGYQPTFYVPYAQIPRPFGVLAVRTRGEEAAIAPAVRQIFQELDPNLPLTSVHSALRLRDLRTTGMQFVAGLMSAFAGIGLFLSAIGIYGVMAYSVSQRTREIGVRMALGATTREVMGMTLRDAATLASIGIAVGLVAAFGLGKLLAANLFGVVELDAATFGVVAAVLGLVAVAAGSVPARRAMRVDPITALRAE